MKNRVLPSGLAFFPMSFPDGRRPGRFVKQPPQLLLGVRQNAFLSCAQLRTAARLM